MGIDDIVTIAVLTIVTLVGGGTLLLAFKQMKPGFGPQNLVAAAYANYASVIAKRAEIKECPGCGRMFFPESGKQKYCTKSCASTSRWRRWKARQEDTC